MDVHFQKFARALRAGVTGDIQVRYQESDKGIDRRWDIGERAAQQGGKKCLGAVDIMKLYNEMDGVEQYVHKRAAEIHASSCGQIVKHGRSHCHNTSRNDGRARYDTFRREGESATKKQLSLLRQRGCLCRNRWRRRTKH